MANDCRPQRSSDGEVLVARGPRSGRGADAEPAGGAQLSVRGADRRADRRDRRDRRAAMPSAPSSSPAPARAFSSGHDLKELTAHRNDQDRGRAFFAKTMAACSEHDADHRALAEAGDRRGERHRHRRRLPARRELRSRGGEPAMRVSPRPGSISGCSARRRWWRSAATCRARQRWRCCCSARWSAPSDAKSLGLVNRVVAADRVVNEAVELGRQIAREAESARSRSARRPSTASSRCRSTRPMPMPLR